MNSTGFPDRHRTLGALLRRPYEILAAWLYAELARQGFPELRASHSAVFRTIAPEGSRVSELARRAGLTKQSMAYLVEQLVEWGYAEIEPDSEDRRAKRVRLTVRGEAAQHRALALSSECEARLAERLGQKEMRQLRRLLERLYEQLESGLTPPPSP